MKFIIFILSSIAWINLAQAQVSINLDTNKNTINNNETKKLKIFKPSSSYSFNSSNNVNLNSSMKNALDQLGDYLIANPNIRIRIKGHTDASGNNSTRLEISSKRAEEAKNYLVKNKRISANRILTSGRGSLELLKTYPPVDKRQNRIVIEINPTK